MSAMLITLYGTIAGMIGTILGGILGVIIKQKSKTFLSVSLSLAAGIMVAVTTFDLIPRAVEYSGIVTTILGILAGVLFMMYLENIICKKNLFNASNPNIKIALLTAVGIAMHNFPEGLAIGSGFDISTTLGFKLMLIIAIHDIPEGFIVALPMRRGGASIFRTMLWTFIAGAPVGIGALIGAMSGKISNGVISINLALAAGAMLYVVFCDLLPQSGDLHRGRINGVGVTFGIILGILISFI